MADITAHFTIYRGQHNGDLKHVSTVLRQSNLEMVTASKSKTF